jgi:hypothetical protein
MLMTFSGAIAAVLLQTATAAPQDAGESQASDAAVTTVAVQDGQQAAASTETKITDRSHPDYVRCRSQRVIGSLAKRTKTCMTNREWEIATRAGNRGARDIVESQQVGLNAQ